MKMKEEIKNAYAAGVDAALNIFAGGINDMAKYLEEHSLGDESYTLGCKDSFRAVSEQIARVRKEMLDIIKSVDQPKTIM